MKYLKKFNESINNDYYQKISHSEYLSLLDRRMNDNEEDIIGKRVKERTPITMKDIFQSMCPYSEKETKAISKASKKSGLEFDDDDMGFSSEITLCKNSVVIVSIDKISDEWYLASIGDDNLFYKCDQLEGLVKFIETEKAIKKSTRYKWSSKIVNESVSEKLFEEIERETFEKREYTHGNNIDWTKSVEDELISKVGGEFRLDLTSVGPKVRDLYITNFKDGEGDKRFQLIITQSPDDWFYVEEKYFEWHKGVRFSSWRQQAYRNDMKSAFRYESFFKCDTIDGLVECINNSRERLYKRDEPIDLS
jgi:hypothetical protein